MRRFGRRDESEMLIKPAGVFVLGVDRQGRMPTMSAAWIVRSIASLSRPAPIPWPCDPLLTASRASSMDVGTGMAGQALGQSVGARPDTPLRPRPASSNRQLSPRKAAT